MGLTVLTQIGLFSHSWDAPQGAFYKPVHRATKYMVMKTIENQMKKPL